MALNQWGHSVNILHKFVLLVESWDIGHICSASIQVNVLERVDRASLKFDTTDNSASEQSSENGVLSLGEQKIKLRAFC